MRSAPHRPFAGRPGVLSAAGGFTLHYDTEVFMADACGTGVDRSVSSVLPSPIATPLRRRSVPGEDPSLLIGPETVADVILFLATRPPNVIIPEIAIYPRAFI